MTRCPICEREAKHIPPTGDADIFDCPSHGVFKVAGTLIALPKFSWASIPDWERALSAARARTKPSDWPLIKLAQKRERNFAWYPPAEAVRLVGILTCVAPFAILQRSNKCQIEVFPSRSCDSPMGNMT